MRRRVTGGDLTGDGEEAAERMILGLDELASNGLRHGRAPVGLRVCTLPGHWLVDVTDSATHLPPTPSPGRPDQWAGPVTLTPVPLARRASATLRA